MKKAFVSSLRAPIYLVGSLWLIHIGAMLIGYNLTRFGVYPRTLEGVKGIFLSPFIHGSIHHLFSNSVPLFVLMFMILFFYRKVAFSSVMLIYLLTGIGVWAFARPFVFHIGASGVVYGLVSFVFWTGIFRRNLKSIVLALVVTTLYSGYFLGLSPYQEGISWESHLIGGLVGILVAFLFKNSIERDEVKPDPWADQGPPEYFLPRDAFEKTREERMRDLRDEFL